MQNGTNKQPSPDSGSRATSQRRAKARAAGDRTSGNGQLVMIQFKGHRKAFYHNRRQVEVRIGDYCLVEADRGKDLGRACYIGPGKSRWWREARKQGVIGLAEAADLARMHENRGDEWEFYDICQEKIQARGLKMNLVMVERQFDHNKITFYFTAEKRVDFRELVRDLAAIFRTRIELRQIGVRDEARLKGGMGICGREFCCSTFLHEFVPVTLKMAKDQQLPLNPNKLSGLCGRLRCCLTYEYAGYRVALQRLPKIGARVKAGDRQGNVRKLDLVRELITVQINEEGEVAVFQPSDLRWEREQDLPAPRRRPMRRSGRRRN